jgi:hypothetical protein
VKIPGNTALHVVLCFIHKVGISTQRTGRHGGMISNQACDFRFRCRQDGYHTVHACHRNFITTSVFPRRPTAWAFYDLMAWWCVYPLPFLATTNFPLIVRTPEASWRCVQVVMSRILLSCSVPHKYWTVMTLTGHLFYPPYRIDHRLRFVVVNARMCPGYLFGPCPSSYSCAVCHWVIGTN